MPSPLDALPDEPWAPPAWHSTPADESAPLVRAAEVYFRRGQLPDAIERAHGGCYRAAARDDTLWTLCYVWLEDGAEGDLVTDVRERFFACEVCSETFTMRCRL